MSKLSEARNNRSGGRAVGITDTSASQENGRVARLIANRQ